MAKKKEEKKKGEAKAKKLKIIIPKKDVKEQTALSITLANDKALGQIFVDSGFFEDAKSQSQAIVKILAGREVGLQPIESMTGIHVIKGKISFGANMMAAAVKKHPNYDYKVKIHTNTECVIDFFEIIYDLKDRLPTKERAGTSEFTIDDAKRAGLSITTGSWYKWPKAMLFARAMSAGVRYYCPDVFGHAPVYVPEEMGATVNEDGEPVDVTPARPSPAPFPEGKSTRTEPEPQEAEVTDESEEEPEPEDDADDTVRDIPDDLIDDKMKPRDALKEIMDYAWKKEIGDVVRPVICKHYEPWENGEPDVWNIPEKAVIDIVEELTGIKTKKAEKVKKCGGCDKKITEPESEEQDGLCLVCFKKSQEEE